MDKQELLESYLNGNISWVKSQLVNASIAERIAFLEYLKENNYSEEFEYFTFYMVELTG